MPEVPSSPAFTPWTPGTPVYLAGSTAVGKSEVALSLAEQIGGEIISVDSMQVYRGMDIGTAKPTRADLDRVPHHLIDVAEISQPFDAAAFCRGAARAVEEIRARGRTPIFCGGTGLYFKAWMEGLGTAPARDLALREQLNATPLAQLLDELNAADPVTYARIDRQNPRRVIRAVEVIRLTGKPFSEQRSDWGQAASSSSAVSPIFLLQRPVEELWARINQRVDAMMLGGWLDETKRLRDLGLEQNANAVQAIGYRELLQHLKGEMSLGETVERIKIHTRQFARRQRVWFRGQAILRPVEVGRTERAQEVVIRLRASLASSG